MEIKCVQTKQKEKVLSWIIQLAQKERNKKKREILRETVSSIAVNPQSELQLLRDTFKNFEQTLVDNVYYTLNIIKNHHNISPVIYKSFATCLTINLPLNEASNIFNVNSSTLSKY